MANVTYDPILETQEIRRFRVFTPISPPRQGTALILEREFGPALVITPEDRVPDPRLGNYKRSYHVDLAQRGLRMEEGLTSKDPAFVFRSTVTFNCQIVDPAFFALRGIRDMIACLRPALVRTLRGVAAQYDIAQFNEAEAALNRALDSYPPIPAVHLDNFLVELSASPKAIADSSNEYYDAARTGRLESDLRNTMSHVVAGGRDALFAQWLTKHGGDPAGMLEHEAAAKALASEQLLKAMSILTSSGGETEPFDTQEERDRLLTRFLSGDPDSSRDERRTSLRGRLSGSLIAGTTEKPEKPEKPAGGANADSGDGASAEDPDRDSRSTRDTDPEAARTARPGRLRGMHHQRSRGQRTRTDPDAPAREPGQHAPGQHAPGDHAPGEE